MEHKDNRYELAAASLMIAAGVEIAKYRTSTTGRASIKDGRRVIETPRPRGVISFATLAHEVGHHVLGHLLRRQARWIEEVEAWDFALNAVQRFDLPGYERAHADAAKCIAYAFRKALRRGVKPEDIRDRYPVWWKDVYHDMLLTEIVS